MRTEDLAWLVYVLLAGTAVFAAAFEPASMAAMPNLVDERDLSGRERASGSLWGTMLAVGGALGGVVAGVFGSDVAIVVDSASFVLSALLILGIHADLQRSAGRSTNAPACGRTPSRPCATRGRTIGSSRCSR